MKKNKIEGWLFDVDELGSGVALWIYDAGGKLHRLTREFSPPIYVSGATLFDCRRVIKAEI